MQDQQTKRLFFHCKNELEYFHKPMSLTVLGNTYIRDGYDEKRGIVTYTLVMRPRDRKFSDEEYKGMVWAQFHRS